MLSNSKINKINRRLDHTRASAKRRSKDFNLDFNYLKNILDQKVCAYSGESFNNSVEGEKLSLERFNNDIGYIKGNVIPVKKKYNTARSDLTLEELIGKRDAIARRIANPSVRKVEKLNLDEKKWAQIKKVYGTILKIRAKRENRVKHMANMMKNQPLSNESKLRIVALKARINGSHQAEGHELTKLNVLLKGSDWKTKTKLTDAESLFDTYDKVIQGLQRFEKIGFIGKLKLKRGLPLSASLFQLIKG